MPSDSGVASAARTVEDYADRVERVHAYLTEHLDRDVDLDHLAVAGVFVLVGRKTQTPEAMAASPGPRLFEGVHPDHLRPP